MFLYTTWPTLSPSPPPTYQFYADPQHMGPHSDVRVGGVWGICQSKLNTLYVGLTPHHILPASLSPRCRQYPWKVGPSTFPESSEVFGWWFEGSACWHVEALACRLLQSSPLSLQPFVWLSVQFPFRACAFPFVCLSQCGVLLNYPPAPALWGEFCTMCLRFSRSFQGKIKHRGLHSPPTLPQNTLLPLPPLIPCGFLKKIIIFFSVWAAATESSFRMQLCIREKSTIMANILLWGKKEEWGGEGGRGGREQRKAFCLAKYTMWKRVGGEEGALEMDSSAVTFVGRTTSDAKWWMVPHIWLVSNELY